MKKTFRYTAKNVFFAISCFIGLVSLSACSTKIQAKDDFSCKSGCCWNLEPEDSHKGWTVEVFYDGEEKLIHEVTTDRWVDSINAEKQNHISKVILKDKNGKETSTYIFKNGYPIGVHPLFRNSKLKGKLTYSDPGKIILVETFWPNGQMDMRAEVIDWKKNGKFQLWDCNGKLITDEIYEDNNLVKKLL